MSSSECCSSPNARRAVESVDAVRRAATRETRCTSTVRTARPRRVLHSTLHQVNNSYPYAYAHTYPLYRTQTATVNATTECAEERGFESKVGNMNSEEASEELTIQVLEKT